MDNEHSASTRERVLETLKRRGACTVPELQEAVGVSENTVRHHLGRLRSEGLLEERTATPSGPGRPAQHYTLTAAAEREFPKRYEEFLALVLEEAHETGALVPLLRGVARRVGEEIRPAIGHLPPEERLQALLERLGHRDMLGRVEQTGGGWELHAFNCHYHDPALRFVEVCELLPRIVRDAAGLPCERVICRLAGHRSCIFAGGYAERG